MRVQCVVWLCSRWGRSPPTYDAHTLGERRAKLLRMARAFKERTLGEDITTTLKITYHVLFVAPTCTARSWDWPCLPRLRLSEEGEVGAASAVGLAKASKVVSSTMSVFERRGSARGRRAVVLKATYGGYAIIVRLGRVGPLSFPYVAGYRV